MRKIIIVIAFVLCMMSASTVYAAETDSDASAIGEVIIDEVNGNTVNCLELNSYYYVHELEESWGYILKLNIPSDGRIKVEIEDYTKNTFGDSMYIPCSQSPKLDYYESRYWRDDNIKRDSGWITVKSGIYMPRFYAGTVNQEAKVIVRYQKGTEYSGEAEDNDKFDSANLLSDGIKYEGNFSKESDIDLYKLQLTNPGLVQIFLRDENDDDYCEGCILYKEDEHGNVSKLNYISGSSRIRLGEGIYYFEIKPYFWDSSSEYSLQVNTKYESEDKYEREPNNVKSQANSKKVNVSYTGNLNDEDDYDLYKFEVPKGIMSLEFKITRQSVENSIKITLYDAQFNILDAYENTSNPYYISKSKLHETGTYYVKVERGSSYKAVMTEDYTFSLKNIDYVYVSHISVPKEYALYKGKSIKLTAKVTPTSAMNPKVKWSSSNSSVASVDQNGNVTAKNVGTAVIKSEAQDGSGVCAYTNIKVSIPIKLNKTNLSAYVGKTVSLKLSGTNGTEKWKSSKTSIATVSSKGLVKCKKIGKTKITATYKGKEYSCTITVKPLLKKGTWFAYADGGFYFKIHSIQGNKMKYSVHMPYVTVSKKTAIIKSNGKTATSKFKCKDKKTHSLVITISGNKIKVTETSNCKNKILSNIRQNKKKEIKHTFYPESHFY